MNTAFMDALAKILRAETSILSPEDAEKLTETINAELGKGGWIFHSPPDLTDESKDWGEDRPEDGEIFLSKCLRCREKFTGHKHRRFCQPCVRQAVVKRFSS